MIINIVVSQEDMSNDYQNEDCMLIEEDDEYSSSSCNHGIDSMNPEVCL